MLPKVDDVIIKTKWRSSGWFSAYRTKICQSIPVIFYSTVNELGRQHSFIWQLLRYCLLAPVPSVSYTFYYFLVNNLTQFHLLKTYIFRWSKIFWNTHWLLIRSVTSLSNIYDILQSYTFFVEISENISKIIISYWELNNKKWTTHLNFCVM